MVRERGSGVTPSNVVNLLKKEVSETSLLAVSKSTGLGLAAIGRYLKGIGEPTTATLERLSERFKVQVQWLRGDDPAFDHEDAKRKYEIFESYKGYVKGHNEQIARINSLILGLTVDKLSQIEDLATKLKEKQAEEEKEEYLRHEREESEKAETDKQLEAGLAAKINSKPTRRKGSPQR